MAFLTGPVVRKMVREEVRKGLLGAIAPTISLSGLKCRVLFNKHGYFPHFAEHIIDPIDNQEKLVMADPHIRRSVIIYNLLKREIEWEFVVPGTALDANPHVAHVLMESFPEINGKVGDIICTDRDRRYICVDRDTKEVKWRVMPSGANWPMDVLPSVESGYLIGTDYFANRVFKFASDGTIVWTRSITSAARLSRVEGATTSGLHTNSYGGDYLVVENRANKGV